MMKDDEVLAISYKGAWCIARTKRTRLRTWTETRLRPKAVRKRGRKEIGNANGDETRLSTLTMIRHPTWSAPPEDADAGWRKTAHSVGQDRTRDETENVDGDETRLRTWTETRRD